MVVRVKITSEVGEDVIFKDLPGSRLVSPHLSILGSVVITESNGAFVNFGVNGVILISAEGGISSVKEVPDMLGKLVPDGKVTFMKDKRVNYNLTPIAPGSQPGFPTEPGLYICKQGVHVYENSFIVIPEDHSGVKLYIETINNGSIEKLANTIWGASWSFHKVLNGLKFLITI